MTMEVSRCPAPWGAAARMPDCQAGLPQGGRTWRSGVHACRHGTAGGLQGAPAVAQRAEQQRSRQGCAHQGQDFWGCSPSSSSSST